MLNNMEARNGQIMREDKSIINEANILAPKPLAHETLTITDTATTLTAAAYGAALTAVIQVGTAAIRYWTDGTAPTATEGILLNDGDVVVLQSPDEIAGFKAIRTGSTSAVLQIAYGA